jgi:hypothetical protein
MKKLLLPLAVSVLAAMAVPAVMRAVPGAGSPTPQAAQAPAQSVAATVAAKPWDHDLASAEAGGRIAFVTSETSQPDWSAVNLISSRSLGGWMASGPGVPQDIVVSFAGREAALVGTVIVNPASRLPGKSSWVKNVEVWTSTESPTSGFSQVASAALLGENTEQPIVFAPVEARFVKLRILSTQVEKSTANCGRLKVIEAQRSGYTSIVDRIPALAAVLNGVVPAAPESAAGPKPPPGGLTACSAAPPPLQPPGPESRRVLVVAPRSAYYAPLRYRDERNFGNVDSSIYSRLEFTYVPPQGADPAQLLPVQQFDTVVLAQICDIKTSVSAAFKQALMAWVADGHKLIIQDSDKCGSRQTPDYSFLPYPFASSNPGALGKKGEVYILESNTIASDRSGEPSFLDTDAWVLGLRGNYNELGDANTIVKYDSRWCGHMFGTNTLNKSGFMEAYAKYGRGLIIYDGFDLDQRETPAYRQLVTRELVQGFNPDNLPCSQPVADFVISTQESMKSQYMAAGRTYTYPLKLFSNGGYKGRVTLETIPASADPTVTYTLEPATIDLTDFGKATLSVTTTARAPVTTRRFTVRGTDAAGKSNILCLDLTERRSGSILVLSGLQHSRKPTKNLEIILDASGSMKALLGKKTRWATALDVLADVVAKLPSDFSVGLRAYGHREPSRSPRTCTDSQLVVAVTKLNRDAVLAAAKKLAPRGETPLVYSILQTPTDLRGVGGGTVILITDGEESCGGDLKAAAQKLKASGLDLTLNIVGFTLKSAPAQAQLGSLAESTGGRFYAAQSGEALARAVLLAAVDKLPYRILDASGHEVAKGEAGSGKLHELPAGEYTLVVSAGEEELRTPIRLGATQDLQFTVVIKGDRLAIDK